MPFSRLQFNFIHVCEHLGLAFQVTTSHRAKPYSRATCSLGPSATAAW